ncbi:MAG: ABC transporter permease [Candidatus Dormibacteraeota bacterium]|nr:ABC transporter permease [Candidatus Dormibacteraeota bacterium]
MSIRTPLSTDSMQPGQAVVADRRFQRYQGKRLGIGYAFFSLYVHSIAWVIGWKRSTRYRIVPSIVLLVAYAPTVGGALAATFAPVGAQVSAGGPLLTYWDFYFFALPATYIFVAFTMPELICPDRRHGTLRMYMTSNLNPAAYVAAKVAAAWSVLSQWTVCPLIILFISYSLLGHAPVNVLDWFKTLGQIVAAGLAMAMLYATIGLALSSLTDRSSFASAGIILTFVLSGAALGILSGPLKAPGWVVLLNVNELPIDLMLHVHGAPLVRYAAVNVDTWQLEAAAAGWVVAGLAVLAYRYWGEGRK